MWCEWPSICKTLYWNDFSNFVLAWSEPEHRPNTAVFLKLWNVIMRQSNQAQFGSNKAKYRRDSRRAFWSSVLACLWAAVSQSSSLKILFLINTDHNTSAQTQPMVRHYTRHYWLKSMYCVLYFTRTSNQPQPCQSVICVRNRVVHTTGLFREWKKKNICRDLLTLIHLFFSWKNINNPM